MLHHDTLAVTRREELEVAVGTADGAGDATAVDDEGGTPAIGSSTRPIPVTRSRKANISALHSQGDVVEQLDHDLIGSKSGGINGNTPGATSGSFESQLLDHGCGFRTLDCC